MALVVKNLPANAGNIRHLSLILGLERSPRKGYGNPLQYSCLENPMNREAWQATVHRVAKSWKWLSDWIDWSESPSRSEIWASQVGQVVKNLPANAGNIRDLGSIPGREDLLEEGMALHSSILAWRIPWMEDPGRLQSMGLHRVRHNWSDFACLHLYTPARVCKMHLLILLLLLLIIDNFFLVSDIYAHTYYLCILRNCTCYPLIFLPHDIFYFPLQLNVLYKHGF